MHRIHYISCLWLLSAAFLSCKDKETPCPEESGKHFPLTEDSSCVPYSGMDNLYFEIRSADSTILDTLLFSGGGKEYRNDIITIQTACAQKASAAGFQITYHSVGWPHDIVLRYEYAKPSAIVRVKYQGFEYVSNAEDIKFSHDTTDLWLAGRYYYFIDRIDEQLLTPAASREKYQLLMNSSYGILFFRTYGSHIFTRIDN